MLMIPGSLSCLAKACAKENPRYSLDSIWLSDCGDGYQAVATDCKQLIVVHGPSADKPLPDALAGKDGATSCYIPASLWDKKLREAGRQPAMIAMNDAGVSFLIGNVVSSLPKMETRFPNVAAVIKQDCFSMFRVAVDPLVLANVLTIAAKLLGEEDRKVVLHFQRPSKPMLVTGQSPLIRFEACVTTLT